MRKTLSRKGRFQPSTLLPKLFGLEFVRCDDVFGAREAPVVAERGLGDPRGGELALGDELGDVIGPGVQVVAEAVRRGGDERRDGRVGELEVNQLGVAVAADEVPAFVAPGELAFQAPLGLVAGERR